MKYNYIIILVLFISSCGPDQKTDKSVIQYKPYSTATLQLRYVGPLYDTIQARLIASTLIPRNESWTKLLSITQNGNHYLSIELDRPNTVNFSLNDAVFHIMMSPGDTSRVSLSGDPIELVFGEEHRDINRYLLERDRQKGFDIYSINKNGTYEQVFSRVDSVIKIKKHFLDDHSRSDSLPEWFYKTEKAEFEYSAAYYKIQFPISNKNFKDTLGAREYDFLSSVKINNEDAIYSSWYFIFLDEYFIRSFDYHKFNDMAGFDRADTIYSLIQEKAHKILTGEPRRIYDLYMFGIIAPMTSDSIRISALARKYGVTDLHNFDPMFRSKDGVRYLQRNEQVEEFHASDISGKKVSIRDFSDKIVYLNFWSTWCEPCVENIPHLNSMIDEFSGNNNIVFVNICKRSELDVWKRSIKKHRLKGVNLFLEDGDTSRRITSVLKMVGVPVYVLLDKENRLLENNTGKAPEVKKKIDKILEKKHQ